MDSCNGDAEAFSLHVRAITRERISEGYYLMEMQRALTNLEAAAWHVVVDQSNVFDLVRHLGVVTTVIGRAKDELAVAFLEDARRCRQELRRLCEGTDAIEADEVMAPALART